MPRKRTGTIEWVPGKNGQPGHYKARITLANGARPWIHLEPGLSEERARASAASKSEKAKGATYTPKRGPKALKPHALTIKALVAPWTELIERAQKDGDLAPATVGMHKSNASNHLGPFVNLRPEELTSGVLRRWIRDLREQHAASTVRNIFGTLSKLIDDAMGEEWIDLPANPTRHPKVRDALPTVEAPERIRHFTEAQAAALIGAPKTPDERRLRYLVAFTTGLRDGEISALRWSSIEDEQSVKVFRIARNLAMKGPEGHATEKGTKTRAGRRLMPIHSLVLRALEAWKTAGWRALVGRSPKDDDPLFPGRDGAPHRPRSSEHLRADLEAAELPTSFEGQPFEFNDARHSFSTWLAAAGVAEGIRDRLMGHSPRTVAERHYTAKLIAQLQEAVETIRLGHDSESGKPPPNGPTNRPANRPEAPAAKASQEATSAKTSIISTAEEKGFEPLVGCPTAVFKTAAFDRSATPPST